MYGDTDTKGYSMKEKMSGSDAMVPPPPYSDSNGLHIFEVHYQDWKSHIAIVDQRGAIMFSGHRESASTRLEVRDGNQNVVGSSKASSLTTRIDVGYQDSTGVMREIEIHNQATFGSPRYSSFAFANQQMTWKNKFLTRKVTYDLLDEAGRVYAKFESNPSTKVGKLEILSECLAEDRLKELMVTFLTIFVRKLRNMNDIPQYGVVN